MVRVWLISVALLAVLTATAVGDDDAKKAQIESLREEVSTAIESGEWKAAKRALQKLRAKAPKYERTEIDAQLRRVSGELDWIKIEKKAAKASKGKVRASYAKVMDFRKEYKDVRELIRKSQKLYSSLRRRLFRSIENFEKDDDLDPDLRVVTDDDLVKEGRRAARWSAGAIGESSIYFENVPRDWSKYRYVTLWVHSKKKGGRVTIDAFCTDDDYFESWNNIDWVGWKRLRVPFQGKGARFSKNGKASWTNVDSLRIWKDEGKEIDIVIDDVCLERG